MAGEIINRIAQSPLISVDLGDYRHIGDRVVLDIKDQLHMGMILREKDFREYIGSNNWDEYAGKLVAVSCSADAIIPNWAWMMLVAVLEPVAELVVFGNLDDLEMDLYRQAFDKIDMESFQDKKVVVKGCGEFPTPPGVFLDFTRRVRPYVNKLMFGEPCSSVPIYRKKKEKKGTE